MTLGQTSCMAILDTIPCGKSCHISIDGNAKSSWFERKKVQLNHALFYIISMKVDYSYISFVTLMSCFM